MTSPKSKSLRSNSLTCTLLDVKQLISSAKEEIIGILKSETSRISVAIESLSVRMKTLEDGLAAVDVKQKQQEHELNSIKDCLLNKSSNSPSEIVEEIEQRMERKRNLIIRGLAEDSSGTKESRQEHDERKFSQLMKELDVKNVVFKSLFRIGRIRPGGSRLIKVKGLDVEKQREVLRHAKALRKSKDFSHVYINCDMTPMEQQQHRMLLTKLRELREQGQDVYIYKGKIQSRDNAKDFQ